MGKFTHFWYGKKWVKVLEAGGESHPQKVKFGGSDCEGN
jgi:hypothetical protein